MPPDKLKLPQPVVPPRPTPNQPLSIRVPPLTLMVPTPLMPISMPQRKFAVPPLSVKVPLEPAPVWLSLKADPEEFSELIENPGVIPAPYMARAKWIAIENERALPRTEVFRLVSKSYAMVFAKLSKKLQAELAAGKKVTTTSKKSKVKARQTPKRKKKPKK